MREPSKGGCGFGRTKCGWHIHDPVSLALRPGHSRTSQTRLRGCGKAGTGGFFEGVYQVDTCICLMYIFLEVYCLSACSNRFARSASKQSDGPNECGTPSLFYVYPLSRPDSTWLPPPRATLLLPEGREYLCLVSVSGLVTRSRPSIRRQHSHKTHKTQAEQQTLRLTRRLGDCYFFSRRGGATIKIAPSVRRGQSRRPPPPAPTLYT